MAPEQYLSPTASLTTTTAIIPCSSCSDRRLMLNAYFRASSTLRTHHHHQFCLKLLEIDEARREEARLSLPLLEHPHMTTFSSQTETKISFLALNNLCLEICSPRRCVSIGDRRWTCLVRDIQFLHHLMAFQ
ncbi:conserved hypothetical protein [Ricinus communis]|uniref:Uncharacterized protein n=1 Tax=Ricinus communis TaxID=3988 RepID=B9RKV5_RICCO|nr:conserved hypothetical protein [Ricinus communis]